MFAKAEHKNNATDFGNSFSARACPPTPAEVPHPRTSLSAASPSQAAKALSRGGKLDDPGAHILRKRDKN